MLNNLNQKCLKLLQKEQFTKQKTAEATGELIGNKIANKITKVSKNLQQKISEAVTNKHDKGILKERSPEKRQEIIDDSRLE